MTPDSRFQISSISSQNNLRLFGLILSGKKKFLTQKVMMLNKFHLSLSQSSWTLGEGYLISWMNETELTGSWFIFLKNSVSPCAFCLLSPNIICNSFQVPMFKSEHSVFSALLFHRSCTNDLFPFSVYNASKFYTKMLPRKLLAYMRQSLSYSVSNDVEQQTTFLLITDH